MVFFLVSIRMMEVPRPVWDQVKDTPEVKMALEKETKKL